MNNPQSDRIMKSMIAFISTQGRERVDAIQRQTKEDFTSMSQKKLLEKSEELKDQMVKDVANAEVKAKIAQSKKMNEARINRMRETNKMVESLLGEAGERMAERMSRDSNAYSALLKDLLVQGLIRLIEGKVTLRCRASDVSILSSVIDDAVAQYKESMLTQVKSLEGRDDLPCAVTIDQDKFLPEYNKNDPTNSCLGGFVMYARKNRIVCSQTLDDRLAMTFQQSIPEMRASLYPSLAKRK
jgi:V-type H+-transporting ATPase subunit E|eukprot:Macronucleus_2490.p1 GENE.Macronucleus_2490~~Macronucleus_2490.p1  ORF type:complete len:242 (+),score=81.53 Macronucleus_2490:1-726(+)